MGDVKYVVPAESQLIKLMVDKCKRVHVDVEAKIVTQTIEIAYCESTAVVLSTPLGTLQVDECQEDVEVLFAEVDHIGRIYHQNSPGLKIGWRFGSGENSHQVGRPGAAQWCTGVDSSRSHSAADV